MKKLIIILALMPLIISSCKKSNDETNSKVEEKLYKINLSLDGLKQELQPMAFKSGTNRNNELSEAEQANAVAVFIYGADNNLVAKKESYLIDPYGNPEKDADKFNFDLPKGNYKISAIAYDGSVLNNVNSLNSITMTYGGYNDNNVNRTIARYSEIYTSAVLPISVEKDETIDPLKLNRISSRIQIEIKDEIPAEVDYILVGGLFVNRVYPFTDNPFSQSVTTNTYLKYNLSSQVGEKGVLLSSIIYPLNTNNENSDKLEVLMFSKTHVLLSTKIIEGLIVKPNHITKLSGNLFDEYNGREHSNSLAVEFVREYSDDQINIEF